MGKQTVIITTTGLHVGEHSENIVFRFQPKKLIVRQIGIKAAGVLFTYIRCSQLSNDILAAVSSSTTETPVYTVANEFDLSHTNLQTGFFKFEFFNISDIYATITELLLVLEFSD